MPDTRIPRRVVTALAAGEMTLATAIRTTGLHKNTLFRALAKGVMSGEYPDALLEHRSIESVYETLDEATIAPGEGEAEAVKLRRKLKEAQTRAREAESELQADRAMSEILCGLTSAASEPPEWCTDSVDRHLGKAPSTPILCIGDWHYGEVVNPHETGGYAFDSDIAEARIEETIRKAVSLSRDALAGLEYPGIICALIGDFTSGALHPELAESDEHSIYMSILRVRDLLTGAIKALAEEFGKVFVPTTVGNHGRNFDRKPRAKGYTQRNSDWLIYQLVAREFDHDPRVTVMVPDAGETIFRVYGRSFLLTHGDQLGTRGGDGIIGAIGPIMRGSLKTLKSIQSLGTEIDHMIIGHWHQSIYLPQVTVNGALKGPDEYAMRILRAAAEDPSQTLMMVHPEHGITFRQPIYLRDDSCPDRSESSGRNKWVEAFTKSA